MTRNLGMGWFRGTLVVSLRDILLGSDPSGRPCSVGFILLFQASYPHVTTSTERKGNVFSHLLGLFLAWETAQRNSSTEFISCHWPETSNDHLEQGAWDQDDLFMSVVRHACERRVEYHRGMRGGVSGGEALSYVHYSKSS